MKTNRIYVYSGLKSIGEKISSLYMNALSILHNKSFKFKSQLQAHVLREIVGGLRVILAATIEKIKILKDF